MMMRFKVLISDAISNGQVVLEAETRTKQKTAIARDVIQASVWAIKESIALGT